MINAISPSHMWQIVSSEQWQNWCSDTIWAIATTSTSPHEWVCVSEKLIVAGNSEVINYAHHSLIYILHEMPSIIASPSHTCTFVYSLSHSSLWTHITHTLWRWRHLFHCIVITISICNENNGCGDGNDGDDDNNNDDDGAYSSISRCIASHMCDCITPYDCWNFCCTDDVKYEQHTARGTTHFGTE